MPKAQTSLTTLKTVCRDTETLVKTLVNTSNSISKLTNGGIFGVLGGTLGVAAGVIIPESAAVSQLIILPVLCTLGISSGVFIHRILSGSIGAERTISQSQAISSQLINEYQVIEKLGAPEDVKRAFWDKYKRDVFGGNTSEQVMLTDERTSSERDVSKLTQISDVRHPD